MTNHRIKGWFLYGLAVAIVILWFSPVAWISLNSFKTRVQITSIPPQIFFEPTLLNYEQAFGKWGIGFFILNSLTISSLTTVGTLVLAFMAAYSFARFNFRGKQNIGFWIISQRFLPPIAVLIPLYIMLKEGNLLDTIPGLVLVYIMFTLPYGVWLLYGFIKEIPKEIEEAAMVDGCSLFRLIPRIVVPLAAPGLAVTAVFTFITAWNEYIFALILTSTQAKTMTIRIGEFILPYNVLWGEMSASTVIALMPIAMVIYFLERYIVRGLTMGAVKG